MNRKSIALEIQRLVKENADVELTQTACLSILSGLQDSITSSLVNGEDVSLSDFARLTVKERKATRKSHPQKPGEMIEVPAKRVVKIVPYGALKEAVN